MVKQYNRNAILLAGLSIHEGSPVHVNRLGNRISISIRHRYISCHLSWFRQTHRMLRAIGGAQFIQNMFPPCLSSPACRVLWMMNETERSHINWEIFVGNNFVFWHVSWDRSVSSNLE